MKKTSVAARDDDDQELFIAFVVRFLLSGTSTFLARRIFPISVELLVSKAISATLALTCPFISRSSPVVWNTLAFAEI